MITHLRDNSIGICSPLDVLAQDKSKKEFKCSVQGRTQSTREMFPLARRCRDFSKGKSGDFNAADYGGKRRGTGHIEISPRESNLLANIHLPGTYILECQRSLRRSKKHWIVMLYSKTNRKYTQATRYGSVVSSER